MILTVRIGGYSLAQGEVVARHTDGSIEIDCSGVKVRGFPVKGVAELHMESQRPSQSSSKTRP